MKKTDIAQVPDPVPLRAGVGGIPTGRARRRGPGCLERSIARKRGEADDERFCGM